MSLKALTKYQIKLLDPSIFSERRKLLILLIILPTASGFSTCLDFIFLKGATNGIHYNGIWSY